LYDSSLQSVSKPSANALSWFGTTCLLNHFLEVSDDMSSDRYYSYV
jgi:hypothetical protein